jgi:MoaA/NifB/PqqE/SkfB family radical SAM enzyme
MNVTVDIEVTNRCNAECHFCPRDQTPHQGLMSKEVFDKALERAIEFREVSLELLDMDVTVSLCGLGEPLLNKLAPYMVEQVKAAGFRCAMSSNGAILDERRATQLLDAGLDTICLNVGDRDEGYEEVYKLPFEKTRANVARFVELAEGRCEVAMVLVDHRRSPEHIADMRKYWGEYGVTSFIQYDIINRGGALFVDAMQYGHQPALVEARQMLEEHVQDPSCAVPFGFLFVGYDGNYYLCCSDWKKEVPFGTVFDASFIEITRDKLSHVKTRGKVCDTCNHDPINRMTDEIRAFNAGEVDQASVDGVRDALVESCKAVDSTMAKLESVLVDNPNKGRATIPVRAL